MLNVNTQEFTDDKFFVHNFTVAINNPDDLSVWGKK